MLGPLRIANKSGAVACIAALGLIIAGHLEAEPAVLQELKTVQKDVQSAWSVTRQALVALETADGGAASGVIVSSDGLVLTAAHVVCDADRQPLPGRRLKVFFGAGHETSATALGMDVATDAAMVRLEGNRHDWPYVSLQRNGRVSLGDWCFALGHPGGYDETRGEVLRVGKVLRTTSNSLQTDCVLMGGDSGGPLFNLQGELIGIHSQIWAGREQNVHVALAPFLRSWDLMKQSVVVRVWDQGSGGWLGLATRMGGQGRLEVADVVSDSPAARAGLRAGDALLAVDHRELESQSQFTAAIRSRAAGEAVVLQVRNRSGERTVTVKLSTRPDE